MRVLKNTAFKYDKKTYNVLAKLDRIIDAAPKIETHYLYPKDYELLIQDLPRGTSEIVYRGKIVKKYSP